MAFRQFFFDTPEETKIVLPKFLNCTCWPRELNQKGFFPRNIHYRARLKGPLFQFFSVLCDLFEFFFTKFLLEFCDRMERTAPTKKTNHISLRLVFEFMKKPSLKYSACFLNFL